MNTNVTLSVDSLFDTATIEDAMRRTISALLMHTDEQHPLPVRITVPGYDDQGLSELEKPFIDRIFQEPSQGIIWYHLNGAKDYDELEEDDTYLMQAILEGLKETGWEDVIHGGLTGLTVTEAEEWLRQFFWSSVRQTDDRIYDGLPDGDYLMCRSFDVSIEGVLHDVRVFYARTDYIVTDVDVHK